MPRPDPLHKHNITPPAFDRTKLHRARLVDALLTHISRKLIVLAAPAGYGKTTLLADFAAHADIPTCWVRLTAADRDAVRLAETICASLGRRHRKFAAAFAEGSMGSGSPAAMARAIADGVTQSAREPFVLVLDDVHLLNASPQAIDLLDVLTAELPEPMTIIAAGREVLEVSLARLMADGDLAGFGPHDLAFTADELVELSRLQGGEDLSLESAEALIQSTRGWITGLLLTGNVSAAYVRAFTDGGQPLVYDYLASVVLGQQAPATRQFMLDAACLPVMSVQACDTVLRATDSGQMLPLLVKKGLFVSVSEDQATTFEFHPLFRQFLLDAAGREDPRRLKRLRMRAAGYLSRQGRIEEAVETYLEAGSRMRAAGLIEKNVLEMTRKAHFQTVEQWMAWAEEHDLRVPGVYLRLAWLRLDQGKEDEARQMLLKARAQMDENPPIELWSTAEFIECWLALGRIDTESIFRILDGIVARVPPGTNPSIDGSVHEWRAVAIVHAGGEKRLAEQELRLAIELFQQTGDSYREAMSLVKLFNTMGRLGRGMEADAYIRKALAILDAKYNGSPDHILALNNYAVAIHARGEIDDAMQLFQRGLRLARRTGSPRSEGMILLGEADIFNDLGMAVQAAELYDQGILASSRGKDPWMVRYGCLMTSALHRHNNQLETAEAWLQRGIAVDGGRALWPMIQTQTAAVLSARDPARAASILDELLRSSEWELTTDERALALFHLVRAHWFAGNVGEANEQADSLLGWVSTSGGIQLVAAELRAERGLQKFIDERHGQNPAWQRLLGRVQMLERLSHRFGASEDREQGPNKLVVRALGASEISFGERLLLDLKPLSREVLLFLIDRRRVDRDILLEQFWPDYMPGRQAANLHMAIYGLRRELGKAAIVLDSSAYALGDGIELEFDVNSFEHAAGLAEHIAPGDPRRLFALTEAVNTYGGLFLPELASSWVLDRRRVLETRYLDLLAETAAEAMVRGQPETAARCLRLALDIDPFRDDVHYRYLEALGDLGRQSQIVSHYHSYVRLLADELGLDPPEPVRALYQRLIS